jgi:hypothetical protein
MNRGRVSLLSLTLTEKGMSVDANAVSVMS